MTTASMTWNPTLTDRQRVLLHTQPLIMLRHNWLMREDDGQRYDPLCLSMKLFDVVIDQSGFGHEVVRETIRQELVLVLKAVDAADGVTPDEERYRRVVDRLLGGLMNESRKGESFTLEYADFDASGAATQRSFSFKLLREVHGYSGEIALQLSSEAINLFLNALNLDIESEQIANEAVVQFQLERGKFDKARTGAEAARGRSLQYEQKIQRVIEQTQRDIRQVDWRKDVHQTLVEANEHVEGRLRMEEDILRSAREKLASLGDDEENRESLAAIIRLMGDCRSRHLRLNKRLMTARSEFIEQQSRQCFIDGLRTAPINLRDDVLAPLLRLSCNDAIGLSEQVGHAFIGPIAPRLLSLRELLAWELQPRRIQSVGESPVDELEVVETSVERQRLDEDVLFGSDKVLEDISGEVLLSELLRQMDDDGCPEAVQDAVVLRVLEQFDPGDAGAVRMVDVELGDMDALHARRCVGDDLLIDTTERGGPHEFTG